MDLFAGTASDMRHIDILVCDGAHSPNVLHNRSRIGNKLAGNELVKLPATSLRRD